MREPEGSTPLALAYTGAIAPEIMQAASALMERYPGLGILAITSPDRLYDDWRRAPELRTRDPNHRAHVETLLALLAPDAGIVSILDGHPLTLSWLSSVQRNPIEALGVTRFGESGDIDDLYRKHGVDADSIVRAANRAASWSRLRRH